MSEVRKRIAGQYRGASGYGGGTLHADLTLSWRSDDPDCVRVVLDGLIRRVAVNDLLEGMSRPAGLGDVAVHPAPRSGRQRTHRVCLVVRWPNGRRRECGFPATAVGAFLADVLAPADMHAECFQRNPGSNDDEEGDRG